MKNNEFRFNKGCEIHVKTIVIMKMMFTFLFLCVLQSNALTMAQTISMHKKQARLEEVFREIRRQTKFNVICRADILESSRPVNVHVKNKPLTEFLTEILDNQQLTFVLKDKNIVVSKKRSAKRNLAAATSVVSLEKIRQMMYSGLIKDEKGLPLENVNIRVKDKQARTVSDKRGEFQIQALSGDSLLVSHINYHTQTIVLSSNSSLVIELAVEASALEEVVVAYGTQKRNKVTGAISVVTPEQLEHRPAVSASTALQGLAPGVTVTSQTGAPGGDGATINFRGVNTFGGSSSAPLVIIDGVAGNLNNVDINQIASISFLKDAASAAIYGSRAANGVILVTTKRAKDGFSLDYKGYSGWQEPTAIPRVTNGRTYMEVFNQASINDGGTEVYSPEDLANFDVAFAANPDNYDWQKAILQGTGFTQNHYVALMANSGIIKVAPSISYVEQDGIIRNTDFKRYTLRNNMDITPNEQWNIRLDLSVNNKDRLQIAEEDVVWNYLGRMPTNIPVLHDGGLWSEGWVNRHPVAFIEEGGNLKTNNLEFIGNLNIAYRPTDWLTLQAMVAPRYLTRNTHRYVKSVMTYNEDGSEAGAANTFTELTETGRRYLYGTSQFTAQVEQSWNKHNVQLLLGASRESYNEKYLMGYRRNFTYDSYEVLRAGADDETKNNDGNEVEWLLVSGFGRLNYDFDNKYLLEANFRYDGSSRFQRANRWAMFPSFSAGWRISEEPFMASIKHIVNELKLRGSWGKLGNQNIGATYYPFMETLDLGSTSMGGNLLQTVTQMTQANPALRWEETTMSGIGLDATLFQKLSVSLDWYDKTTDGILLKLNTSQLIGRASPFQNAAVVSNKGWEAALRYDERWNDFSFGLGLNFSDVSNKIVDMRGQVSGSLLRQQEGYPVNSIFGYIADGIYQNQAEIDNGPTQIGTLQPGDIRYRDIAGAFDEQGNPMADGKITDDDKVIIGNTIPRYNYGVNLHLGWRGFRFSTLLQGVGKADGYLNSHYVIPAVNSSAVKEWQLDYWTVDNADATLPRLSVTSANNTQNSTFWMKSNAYLRLKNIHLGYEFPHKLFKNSKVRGIYLYANGQNLLTWSNFYEGYDPEINYDGAQADGVSLGGGAYYPQTKVYTFGVDIKF